MKFLVLAVGNRMPAWIEAGFQEYAKRMPRGARMELREVRPGNRAGGGAGHALEEERDRIRAALPPDCEAVALDERGKAVTYRAAGGADRALAGRGPRCGLRHRHHRGRDDSDN